MNHTTDDRLARLVTEIGNTAKYRYVVNDFVRDLGAEELRNHPNYRDALKATKNKLHQIGGAYFNLTPRYDLWLKRIEEARKADGLVSLQPLCRQLMQQHASTKERLPDLERLYSTLFNRLPPIRSVLDVACGLNPLSLPWMKLEPDSTYYAVDIYKDLMHFLQRFITLCGYQAETRAASVLGLLPMPAHIDLALVLKAIPCLEQIDRAAGQTLLQGIHADFIFVTFPVRSLGGRSKGMVANYTARFQDLVMGQPWSIERFDFSGELAFLLVR